MTPPAATHRPLVGAGTSDFAPWQLLPEAIDTIATARLETVMLMCPGLTQENFDNLRARMPNIDIVVRLTGKDEDNDLITPLTFADHVRDSLAIAYANGVRECHIHNEPNLSNEGYGHVWNNGREFAEWWLTVRYLGLGEDFPDMRWGFPALSPDPRGADYWAFMEAAKDAVEVADQLGVHVYWDNPLAWPGAVAAANNFAARYPNKPTHITEFSRPQGKDYAAKGDEYVSFFGADWRPNVQKIYGFPVYATTGWVNEEWAGTAIPEIVGARPF